MQSPPSEKMEGVIISVAMLTWYITIFGIWYHFLCDFSDFRKFPVLLVEVSSCRGHCQEDATLQVRFPSVSLTAWLPESTLTYIEEREPEAPQLKPRGEMSSRSTHTKL